MAETTREDGERGNAGRSPGIVVLLLVALLGGGVAGSVSSLLTIDRLGSFGGSASAAGQTPADDGGIDANWELYRLENLVVNPAGTQGRRYLILSAAIEAEPDTALPILDQADARLRDGILRALGRWSVDDLTDAERREEVEAVVRNVVLDIVGDAAVGRVYFSQYVLQ